MADGALKSLDPLTSTECGEGTVADRETVPDTFSRDDAASIPSVLHLLSQHLVGMNTMFKR